MAGLVVVSATNAPVFVLSNCQAYAYGAVPPETVAWKVFEPPELIGVEFVNEALQFKTPVGSKKDALLKLL
jgi:hypothetical protein